jgi:hypothetical protein
VATKKAEKPILLADRKHEIKMESHPGNNEEP